MPGGMEESTRWKGRKRNGGAISRGRRRLRTDQSKGTSPPSASLLSLSNPFFPFSRTKSSLTFSSRRNESRSKKKILRNQKVAAAVDHRTIITRQSERKERGGAAGLRERIPSRSIHAEHGIQYIPYLPKKMTQGKKRGREAKEKEAA